MDSEVLRSRDLALRCGTDASPQVNILWRQEHNIILPSYVTTFVCREAFTARPRTARPRLYYSSLPKQSQKRARAVRAGGGAGGVGGHGGVQRSSLDNNKSKQINEGHWMEAVSPAKNPFAGASLC